MAAFDAAGKPAATGTGSSLSWTHTPVAGSGFGVVVLVINRQDSTTTGALPSSVTYGGQAMDFIGTVTDAPDFMRISAYRLLSPPAGPQTVLVSWGVAQGASNAVSVSATNVGSVTSLDTATGSSVLASVTPSTTPGANDLVVDIAGSDTGGSGWTTSGANQTQRMRDNTGLSDFVASTQPGSAGSDPMTENVTTGPWFIGSVVLVNGSPVVNASVRAFQEDSDPRAFQVSAFQRPDPTDAFITPLHAFFQENAFQRPDPTGVFQFSAFDDEGYQSDFEAFYADFFQADAFQIDEPVSISNAYVVSGAGAIPSAEAFGQNDQVRRILAPVAIGSSETFGTTRLLRILANAGAIGSAESFGQNDRVLRILAAVAVASAETFGTTKTLRLLYPLGIGSAEAFGTTRVLSPQYVFPQAITSSEAFGVPKVIRLLYPLGVASAPAFGAPALLRRIGPTGIASTETFGLPHVLRLLYPLGIVSGESWGRPSVLGGIQGPYTVSGAGAIASAEAFGQADRVIRILAPVAIGSAETFGVADLLRVIRNAGAIVSGETLGQADRVLRILGPTGVVTREAFGQADRLVRILGVVGAVSSEAFGVAHPTRLIFPLGATSNETFGRPTVGPFVPSPLVIGGQALVLDAVMRSAAVLDGAVYAALVTDLLVDDEPQAADGTLRSVDVADLLLYSVNDSDGI